MTAAGSDDTNTAQAALHAAELEAAIDDAHRVLASLQRGLNKPRSSGYEARLRAQINTRELELAELNRMRFQLRRRFGV